MQVRVFLPRPDGSFVSEKVRLPRRRHLTQTLAHLELFLCSKCRRVVPFDYGCDEGSTTESRLWCDSCWYKHDRK